MYLPSSDRVRSAARTARNTAGRVGTLAGAAALAASTLGAASLALTLPVTAGAVAVGYTVFVGARKDDPPGKFLKALYLSPGITLGAQLVAGYAVPGTHWWEFAATAAWTGIVLKVRPSAWARDLHTPPDENLPELDSVYEVMQPEEDDDDHMPAVITTGPMSLRLASFWEVHVAATGGPAPGTRLDNISVSGPRQWSAHILGAPGQPVGQVNVPKLSALTDIPEELIAIGPVPGSGSGRRRITVGTSGPQSFEELWARNIAPAAMPGTTVVQIRAGDANGNEVPLENM
ncbi:hypothetical protein ACFC1B_07170 [Streptomyces xiamenensis]|uniref:hypothetical protein n=1 Tax=Streptomyces xiamenensis TaxID=408015 RepID=UPI0035DB89BA